MGAIADAGLPEVLPEPERSGVAFGTAIGGIDTVYDNIELLREEGYNRVSPFALPAAIPNYSAFVLARQFQCLGPNSTICTACATSTQSIGEATEFIRARRR